MGKVRQVMNTIIKPLKGKQRGQAFVLVLALLGLGSLLIVPMLSFMGTGLNAGVIVEDKTDELYACDAGVQDAIWQINHLGEPGAISEEYLDVIGEIYDYIDPVIGRPLPHVNGMDVGVRITLEDNIEGFGVYRVQTWVPVQPGVPFGDNWGDASTKIDTIITTTWLDYSDITENVVTSQNELNALPNADYIHPSEGEPNGPVENYTGPWPTAEELIAWYSRDVDKDNPYPYDEIDLDGSDLSIGPEYVDSDFEIINSDNTEATLTLTDTLYITGDTLIGTTNKDFTIDLNGQTIFVESDTVGVKNALEIGGKCTLTGSGCIIAVGDIYFAPNLDSDPDDYILVMSVNGETEMQPNGNFYGTLAGNVVTTRKGDADINWSSPPDDLNFPGIGGDMVWGIHTWMYWDIIYETP